MHVPWYLSRSPKQSNKENSCDYSCRFNYSITVRAGANLEIGRSAYNASEVVRYNEGNVTHIVIRIDHVAYLQPIQRHKGNLAGQALSVHLFEDLRAHRVGLDNVVEETVAGCYLEGRGNTLYTLKHWSARKMDKVKSN